MSEQVVHITNAARLYDEPRAWQNGLELYLCLRGVRGLKRIQVAYYKDGSQRVAQALNVEVYSFGETLGYAEAAIREALL
jgi:hypothetical protein